MFARVALAAALLAADPASASLELTPSMMIGWSKQAFKGETRYRLVEIDGREALYAQCSSSASGLFLERRIDLTETPILEWSWRVDETFPPDIDETTRSGDDYPARIYVVKDGGLLRWRTRALNYVWASGMPEGSDWPNAYASQVHSIAVRSGPPAEPGEWQTERRNVREDFRRYHGLELDTIDGIAIMTDCDDLGTTAQAWYGALRFLPAE